MGHGLERCIVFIFLKMHYFKWKKNLYLNVTGRPYGSVAQWSECSHGLREVLGSSPGRAMCFFLPFDISIVSGRPGDSSYVSQSPSRLSHNTVENFSHPNEISGPQDNLNLSNTGGNEQASDLDPPIESPRRSGRVRQAPNRYGDWLIHQQSVDPEEIIHWV